MTKLKKQDLMLIDPLGIMFQDKSTFVAWIEVAIGYSAQQLIHAGGHFAEILAEFRDGEKVVDIYPPAYCFNRTAGIDEEQVTAGGPTDDITHELFTRIGQTESLESSEDATKAATTTTSSESESVEDGSDNEIESVISEQDTKSDIVPHGFEVTNVFSSGSIQLTDNDSIDETTKSKSQPVLKPTPRPVVKKTVSTPKPSAIPTLQPTAAEPLPGPKEINMADLI